MSHRFRLVAGLLVSALVLIIAALLVSSYLLDPGSKGDTSTTLATPIITVPAIRSFEVLADQSRVDFVTEVKGLGTVEGFFPVQSGTIRLEPVGDQLRVHVYLEIAVDRVETNELVKVALRAAMRTGDYPVAFYVAESRGLVPVTEDEIEFTLDGTLDVHNVEHAHSMTVRAQAVGGEIWAIATSDLDLADHGVTFPPPIESSTIALTARLQAIESQATPEAAQ